MATPTVQELQANLEAFQAKVQALQQDLDTAQEAKTAAENALAVAEVKHAKEVDAARAAQALLQRQFDDLVKTNQEIETERQEMQESKENTEAALHSEMARSKAEKEVHAQLRKKQQRDFDDTIRKAVEEAVATERARAAAAQESSDDRERMQRIAAATVAAVVSPAPATAPSTQNASVASTHATALPLPAPPSFGADLFMAMRHGSSAAALLDPFSGPTTYRSAEQFLKQFRRTCNNLHKSDPGCAINHLSHYLRESALTWYDSHVDGTNLATDWDAFEKAFLEKFSRMTSEMIRNSVFNRSQRPGESVRDFGKEFIKLSAARNIPDHLQVAIFIGNLIPSLKNRLCHKNYATLEDALGEAINQEMTRAENRADAAEMMGNAAPTSVSHISVSQPPQSAQGHSQTTYDQQLLHNQPQVAVAAVSAHSGGQSVAASHQQQKPAQKFYKKPTIAPGPRRFGRCTYKECKTCEGRGFHMLLVKYWKPENEVSTTPALSQGN